MEVMGLMLGEFVDDYTITCVDVFAMPQVSNRQPSAFHFSFSNISKSRTSYQFKKWSLQGIRSAIT